MLWGQSMDISSRLTISILFTSNTTILKYLSNRGRSMVIRQTCTDKQCGLRTRRYLLQIQWRLIYYWFFCQNAVTFITTLCAKHWLFCHLSNYFLSSRLATSETVSLDKSLKWRCMWSTRMTSRRTCSWHRHQSLLIGIAACHLLNGLVHAVLYLHW